MAYDRIPVIELISEAMAAAIGERSSFSRLHPQSYEKALPYPKDESEVDAFIKERIKLHHDTWIVTPLREALRKLRGQE